MSFNFNLNDVKVSTGSGYLQPYTIYENVCLNAVDVVSGTSKNNNTWKAISLTFKCNEGIYKHSIFFIKDDKDFERPVIDGANGGKIERPSAWEKTRDAMAVIGVTFFPEDWAKVQELSSKAKTFDDIAKLFVKAAQKNLNRVSTGMKLIGSNRDGKVYAALPSFTGITCANTDEKAARHNVEVGQWYTWTINPFGKNLTFSTYEQNQKKALNEAKPTEMTETIKEIDNSTDFNLDFEL